MGSTLFLGPGALTYGGPFEGPPPNPAPHSYLPEMTTFKIFSQAPLQASVFLCRDLLRPVSELSPWNDNVCPFLRIFRAFGMDMYTQIYLQWITNKDLLYSTGDSAQCYVAAWMGGEFGGEWIHVCVCLSPFTVHLKLSHCLFQLCSNTK